MWPTPRVGDVSGGDRTKWAEQGKWQTGLREAINIEAKKQVAPQSGEGDVPSAKVQDGQLNPQWVECLMGFPQTWTEV